MRKLLLSIPILFLLPTAALAQSGCSGQSLGGRICGNPNAAQGLPQFTATPTLGVPGTTLGTLTLSGNTSGSVILTPQAVAGTSTTLTLPNTSGTIPSTAASPIVLNAGTGQISCPTCTTGTGGALTNGVTTTSGYSNTQILSSNGTVLSAYSVSGSGNVILATSGVLTTPSITTPTLHTSLLFAGLSSGTVTIVPQSAASTPTLTLPTGTGTFAVTASLPIVLSTTTGNLTCPTCVTSSGGGAITGQAPVAVSAAGVVSITGAAGQVLAGATPAFTATPTLGVAGSTVGSLTFANATSGSITITPTTGALGSGAATLPTGTYNLVGDSLTQALTNKTYNGLTVSTTTGTFTLTNAKTLAVQNSLTFSGTDGKSLVLTNGLTVSGNDGTLSFGAATKTLSVNNSITLAGTDSTTWTGASTNMTLAALNIADQSVTGGANVTTQSLSTGNITVDCGSRPLQSITNGGAFTITAPSNDGSCIVLVTNNASAGTITFSGFNVGTNTGDTLNTTNTNKFMISIARISGSSTYSVKALQ